MTKYEKQIRDFKNMIESRLANAFDQMDSEDFGAMDELYEHKFTLSFMGKSCEISWGATEYDVITDMLNYILEETIWDWYLMIHRQKKPFKA